MTHDQISSIINTLPEGKRKRACLVVADAVAFNDGFWSAIQDGNYGKAASVLLGTPQYIELQVLADMIWEGGA